LEDEITEAEKQKALGAMEVAKLKIIALASL
jgi:hypothetical protein